MRMVMAAAVLLATTTTALAQAPAGPPRGWSVTLGAGALVSPKYEGAKDSRVRPLPFLDIRYGNSFSASVQDGIRFNLADSEQFRFGPVVKYRFGREEGDARQLRGTGDRDGTPEIGFYLNWQPVRWLEAGIETRQGVGIGHGGFLVDLDVSFKHRFGNSVFFSIGPRTTYASEDFMRYEFGITADQARRSGYRRYEPEAGFKDYGIKSSLRWQITPNWSTVALGSVSKLIGDAADSPIVKAGRTTQFTAGFFVGYTF